MPDILDWLRNPWYFLPIGYLFTIAIETPILCVGLSNQHPLTRRSGAGIWLTACTYPIVVLVIPQFISMQEHYAAYLLVAEIVAHFGECALFFVAFQPLKHPVRDMVAVFGANLVSCLAGLLLWFAFGAFD